MDEQTYGLEAIMKGRVATYALLVRLYRREVDQELLDEMCEMRFPVGVGNTELDEGYRLFHAYLGTVWERTLTDLAVDYARVFLGNGMNAYSAAYPFESVHTSSKRLLMQDARDEILAIYRANDLSVPESWKVGEDHISLELEFMRILTERVLRALRDEGENDMMSLLRTQYNFLMDHLVSWTPMLFAEMMKFAQTDFYRALAHLTAGFLATDREFLEDLLDEDVLDESLLAEDVSDEGLSDEDVSDEGLSDEVLSDEGLLATETGVVDD
ncbi:MAG: molecular chaperone TorD family protein [Coriobacteriales bacterium]|nr:molecular chaperone TorD family protein [Coriobacteriales bacterium]